ncbi:Hint domain-containing protein [Pseudorhodobacter sp.]|uniref:Hint domain-containing protein n=1 Tax=Pseudorhodobacter sp. TaxID=1934400 RepID=UPI0039E29FB4
MTYSTATIDRAQTGLANGLVTGACIMTPVGEIPVGCLSVGDRIITRSGIRALRAVHCTVLPVAQLVCISASALGVEMPAEDLHVLPNQGIHIRDWRSMALKGVPQAVFSARDLADGEYIRLETVVGACLYSLEFENTEVIYANGVEVTCPHSGYRLPR